MSTHNQSVLSNIHTAQALRRMCHGPRRVPLEVLLSAVTEAIGVVERRISVLEDQGGEGSLEHRELVDVLAKLHDGRNVNR